MWKSKQCLLEFARQIIDKELPNVVQKVYSVVARDLDFFSEDPFGDLQRFLRSFPDAILFVEEFDYFFQFGRSKDIKKWLYQVIPHAKCKILLGIESHTYSEHFAGDSTLCELFTRIDISEPNDETAILLLEQYAKGLEIEYNLEIEKQAIETAVVVASNHILDSQHPGKGLRVLKLACEDLCYRRLRGCTECKLTASDVYSIVSEHTGVSVDTLSGAAEKCDFHALLKEEIFGQEEAVQEVATELGLIKSGFVEKGKPASVMLFVGQTGTGKTEMAKAISRLYSKTKNLKTYTLGNFIEPHSVAGIIGVPPGYVGHDQGGRIVNELNEDPYCVLLLDEADKAHPDVLQPFLNLFDEGWVRDHQGQQAFGDKCIFILTTNVGQKMISEMQKQGKSNEEIVARLKETIGQIRHSKANRPIFSPEFLARIKRVVVFKPLAEEAIRQITQKNIKKMTDDWFARRGKELVIEDFVVEFVTQKANELNEKSRGKEGGRIVRKVIADAIESRLQNAISKEREEYMASTCIRVGLTQSETESIHVFFEK